MDVVPQRGRRVSLRQLAQHLKLDPSTVSVVLNDVPGRSIATATRERIRAAALELGYRPSQLARSLRKRNTLTVGVLVPLVGEEYHATVLSGIANELEQRGWLYLIVQHHHDPQRLNEYIDELISRGAQGLIAIDTHLEDACGIPVVTVAGHTQIKAVTNVILDHGRAADLILSHLVELGHRRLAVIKGQAESSDAEVRHEALLHAAQRWGVPIDPTNVEQLTGSVSSPELGYHAAQCLLARTRSFSAMLCFNDIAALGAMRALADDGLHVPRDVSVVGFDDIRLSVFAHPSLTSIRQPLQEMGTIAAQTLLHRLHASGDTATEPEVAVKPLLMIRESTGPTRHSR